MAAAFFSSSCSEGPEEFDLSEEDDDDEEDEDEVLAKY